MKRYGLLLALVCVLVLPACGEDQQSPEAEVQVLTYAALNEVSTEIEKSVKLFNKNHTDVQIEIRDYSDEGGLDRLRIEMVLGQIPDIMEMHYFGTDPSRTGRNNSEIKSMTLTSWKFTGNSTLERMADEYWMPYRQMAQKGYLEDLWPYIENDPELGRDGVVHAPLKAAEVNGGLYLLFMDFRINTIMGRESVVGNRYNWTLDDLMESFSTMPEDSTILRYNATKWEIFYNLVGPSLERYVDRSTGECSFDSDDFRSLAVFLNSFPDEVDFERQQQAEEEILWRVRHGEQMLEMTQIPWPVDITYRDAFWGERAAFVGYPTADGSSGNSFYAMGDVLSMSSTCRNKDAAWEYIRSLIKPRRGTRHNQDAIVAFVSTPVNRSDYDLFMWGNLEQLKKQCIKGAPKNPLSFMVPWEPFTYGPEIYPMAFMTEEDVQRYETLLNNTTQLYWPEDDLSNIVWETLGAYFAGDRELDDTIRLINNRVELYLNEQR
ncbi:MAG: hypothetical protein K2N78_11755 [Oscillospiraceae bacterium]|nr:hypothetical protein [Oscillospiraceae bacterium]